ncbi:MAG: vitamin K epoxide reductase family protein, partial [Anaerolineales bacterium]
LILLVIISANLTTAAAQDAPVVRAVLFYSTTCPHCEYVINEVLIPMIETYGQQMLVIGVNVSTEEGSTLFLEMIDQIGYPPDQAGVPFLLVAETVLVGSQEIPEVFPGMVEEGLAGDGIAWPEVQAVRDFLVGQGYLNAEGVDVTPTPNPGQPTEEAAQDAPTPTNPPEDTLTPTETNQPGADPQDESGESDGITRLDDESPLESITMFDRFNLDPLGNGISVIVLLLMIGVVAWIGIQFMQATTPKMWASWILPVLLVIGIAIAAYLASIELTGNEAICGPVGDCNAVQQSEYAKLFGFLPVAVFGLIGYFLIGASWLVARRSTGRLQFYGKMGMFVFALLGLLFFVYLTFLEPFVIGATCAWCLTSGILMILINLYATPVALNAWAEMDIDDYLEDDEA